MKVVNRVSNFSFQSSGYDGSNAFVLPATKRKLIRSKAKTETTKLLSRKQRKRLEKVLDKKKKKSERGELIEKLSSVQVQLLFKRLWHSG